MRLSTIASALVMGALGLACEEQPNVVTETSPTTAEGESPPVTLVGCTFRTATVCEVAGETTLTLWVAASPMPAIEAWYGEDRLDAAATDFPDGRQLRVTIPDQARGEATLRLTFVQDQTRASWSQALRHVDLPGPWSKAKALRSEGKLDQAIAELEQLPDEPQWQVRADGMRARIALMRGEPGEAMKGFRQTVARHRADLRSSDEAADALALVHVLLDSGQLAEAALVLEASREASSVGIAKAWAPYYRAKLAEAGGDLVAAMHGFEAVAALAERVGLSSMHRDASLVLARRLQRLGRHRAAAKRFDGLLASVPDTSCGRAAVVSQLAWSGLLRLEQTGNGSPDEQTLAWLDEAIRIYSDACPKAEHLRMAQLDRALAALHAEDLEGAERLLSRLSSPSQTSAEERIWTAELRGRLALERGQVRVALSQFDEALEVARRALDHDGAWRALVWRGRALVAAHRPEAAETAWLEAEAVLDSASATVPLGQGRASFLGGRLASATQLVAHLVAEGRQAEAEDVARRARARALRSAQRLGRITALSPESRAAFVEAMERYRRLRRELSEALAKRWELTASEIAAHDLATDRLRTKTERAVAEAYDHLDEPWWSKGDPPAEGELRLTFFQKPTAGAYWCFLTDGEGTNALELLSPRGRTSEEIGATLLEPFTARLKQARRLRVLAQGPWLDVDIHALPYDGRPLLASIDVRYGIDLEGEPEGSANRRALVVADAGSDLPHARREGQLVHDALAKGWQVQSSLGTKATRAAITTDLAGAGLFHYAGHGRLRDDRLAIHLELADEDALGIGDILALDAAPRRVVLSGCATARPHDEATLADFSLAAAFVVAGAELVVGTSRPVRDATAAAIASRLYAEASDASWDLGLALRRAQLALSETGSKDWAAYRLITR